jgi:hypothetical protein
MSSSSNLASKRLKLVYLAGMAMLRHNPVGALPNESGSNTTRPTRDIRLLEEKQGAARGLPSQTNVAGGMCRHAG